MSLQVWLPLNGNLNNQGLSDVTVTNSGATVDSNGKIGSCYSFDGEDDFISLTSSSLYSTIKGGSLPFSIAMWVYRVDTTRAILFGDYTLSGGIDFNLEFTTSNKVRFYWRANPDLVFDSAVVTTSKWNHIVVTYDGSTIKCYIDGVFAQSSTVTLVTRDKTSGSYYLGRDARTGTTAFNGKMNDFRLYDHCLSAKEVKEISKGLVCHYKLDNNGFGNPNLITTMSSGGRTTLNGKYGLNADFSQNTDTYGYFNVSPALELDSTYTLSFDVSNFPAGSIWNFKLWNNDNYYIENITKDGHYTYTFVPSESKLPSDYNLTKFLFDDGGRANPAGMVYFTNFKIEKGDRATSWCPHTSDSLYTSLGLNSTAELDCSGYKNDGNKIGDVLPSEPGGRYDTSTYCNSTNIGNNTPTGAAFIKCTLVNPIVNATSLTINWWGNVEDYSYQNSGILSLSNNSSYPDDYTSSALAQYDSVFRFNLTDGNDTSIDSLALIETGNWHMYTLVFNNGIVQGYRDGVSIISNSKSGTLAQFSYIYMGINEAGGVYRQTKSKWSDFRIYSTALSASDIKELYNTSASIDKNGNMYAYEFKEE